jgi:hypothetical protein
MAGPVTPSRSRWDRMRDEDTKARSLDSGIAPIAPDSRTVAGAAPLPARVTTIAVNGLRGSRARRIDEGNSAAAFTASARRSR